jgi:multidrug transporter EmrE-like cation transporter
VSNLKRPRLSAIATIPVKHLDAARSRRKAILLVFCCTILGAAAQLLMKIGMSRFAPDVAAILTNVPLIAGYVLYGINTLMLVLALREGELSMLYPIIALTYVWVTLLSYLLLNEPANLYKNVGITTIVVGVAVLGRGGRK